MGGALGGGGVGSFDRVGDWSSSQPPLMTITPNTGVDDQRRPAPSATTEGDLFYLHASLLGDPSAPSALHDPTRASAWRITRTHAVAAIQAVANHHFCQIP